MGGSGSAPCKRLDVDRPRAWTPWIDATSVVSPTTTAAGRSGVETLAAALLGAARCDLEEVIEPYLIQEGLLQRTPRGRMLASAGYGYLGLTPPDPATQLPLPELES